MSFAPSPALVDKFRGIAEQRVERIAEGMAQMGVTPGAREDLRTLGRELHTLKGEAGMLGFKGVFEIARALEPVLRQAYDGSVEDQLVALLQRGLTLVSQLLRQPPGPAEESALGFVSEAASSLTASDDA